MARFWSSRRAGSKQPLAPSEELAAEHGIHTKSDFRKWARSHHPDKGGSLATFQHVSALCDTVYGSSGTTATATPPDEPRPAPRTRPAQSSSGRSYARSRPPPPPPPPPPAPSPDRPTAGGTAESFDFRGAWDSFRQSGRLEAGTLLSLATVACSVRLHSAAVDAWPSVYGRGLGMPPRPHCREVRLPEGLEARLPPAARLAAERLYNGELALGARLGVSHNLLPVRFRHEVEATVGMRSPDETLPRVLSAGVNLQLPWLLRPFQLHAGVVPALRVPGGGQPRTIEATRPPASRAPPPFMPAAATARDLKPSWVLSARGKVGPLFVEAGWRSSQSLLEASSWEPASRGGHGYPVLGVGFTCAEVSAAGLALGGWAPFRRSRRRRRQRAAAADAAERRPPRQVRAAPPSGWECGVGGGAEWRGGERPAPEWSAPAPPAAAAREVAGLAEGVMRQLPTLLERAKAVVRAAVS
eukprot:jgi/Tetstr1/449089/TSEL_036301.t1